MPAGHVAAGDTPQTACSWIAGTQSTGTGIGLHLNQIGSSEAGMTYASNLQVVANQHPHPISRVGTKAFVACLSSTTCSIDVLAGPTEFSITLISYNIDKPTPQTTLESDLATLGKAIAKEFS